MDRTNNQQSTGGAGQLHPAVTMVTVTLQTMTLTEWYRLPAVVRYFHPYERARRSLVIDTKTKRAAEEAIGP
jgi:hypothetical protein